MKENTLEVACHLVIGADKISKMFGARPYFYHSGTPNRRPRDELARLVGGHLHRGRAAGLWLVCAGALRGPEAPPLPRAAFFHAPDMSTLASPPKPKRKFPRAEAVAVAREMVLALAPHCAELRVAGSLRRRREMIGDVEIVFVSRIDTEDDPGDFFGAKRAVNLAGRAIEALVETGVLTKRLNCDGRATWGERNRYAVHAASGIPVDLFTATAANWWNYLVCRTGGEISNTQIAEAAKRLGWHWAPYDPGFRRGGEDWNSARERHPVSNEREVFSFVRLDYLEPWERR